MKLRLSDEQWSVVAPMITRPPRLETRGRPRRSDRELLEAGLEYIKTWGAWRNVSRDFAPHQTVFRRVKEWDEHRVFGRVLEALARDMEERGGIKLRDCFFDIMFTEIRGHDPLKLVIQLDTPDYSFIDSEPPRIPFPENMREFFQTPRVWRFLKQCSSPWIQERLPADLSERLRFV